MFSGKDKTFFFVSYEGLRLLQPQEASISDVPDASLRASTPAPLQQALNAYPVANGPEEHCNPNTNPNCPANGQSGFAQFIAAWSNPSSIDGTAVRFDRVLNARSKLFFRFSNTDSSSSVRQNMILNGGTPSVRHISAYTNRTYTAGLTSAFTNRLNNDLRFNYTSNEAADQFVIDAFGGAVPANLAQLAGLSNQARPTINIFLGSNTLNLFQQPHQSTVMRQWNVVDSVGFSVGRHQLKFGLDYRRLPSDILFASPAVTYQYNANNGLSDFMNTQVGIPVAAFGSAYPVYSNVSAFADDEWKATTRLNLSFGLRWEVDPAPGVTKGQLPYTVAFTGDPNTWGLAPLGTPLWRTTWYNFAPRLGAAYMLRSTPGWETVLRTGGGVFFDTAQQLGSNGVAFAPGYFAGCFDTGSFGGPVSVPSVNNPVQLGNQVSAFSPHLQLPYTLQWNTSIEQALGKSQVLSVSYVGSHASRLLKTDIFFPPNPVANQPPAFEYQVTGNGLTSDYGSGQVQYQRRLSQGLTALASYTWSHCIDYNSQNYLFGFQRGNCDYDVRHNFSGAFSYDVPSVGHGRLIGGVLGHWGFDDRFIVRTGFPVTLLGDENPDQLTGKDFFSGLDIVTGQTFYVTQCVNPNPTGPAQIPCPGGRGINPKAFTNQLAGPIGNAPRNFIRGFGAWQMNMAIRREFPIYEQLKLQFRAEAFNIFNHPNFGFISTNIRSNVFGEARQTLAGSSGVESPIYSMGGPRSLQFALKLVF